MTMPTVLVSAYLDKHINKAGTRAVKIRVRRSRNETLDLPTDYYLTAAEFDSIMGQPKLKVHRDLRASIFKKIDQVNESISNNPAISKGDLKKAFAGGAGVIGIGTIKSLFLEKINEMENRRLSLNETNGVNIYMVCLRSLESFFNCDLPIHRLNAEKIRQYEKWFMARPGKEWSYNTIGTYMKCIRHIWYRAVKKGLVKKELYPFGTMDGHYQIPSQRDTNENYLELHDIHKLFDCENLNERQSKAFDLWKFMLISFGINPIDVCLLKFKHIDLTNEVIKIYRTKTNKAIRDKRKLEIPLHDVCKEIIAKHGNKSLNPDDFVFPFVNHGMNGKEIRYAVNRFIAYTNWHMKAIGKIAGIEKKPKCQTARHSFSACMIESGASIEQLQSYLGHKSKKTTEWYVHGFSRKVKIQAQNFLFSRAV